MRAATLEFAEHGFDKATIRRICREASANLNAVKYHFGDKEGLYRAVLLEAHEHVHAHCSVPVVPEDLSAEERLRAFVVLQLQSFEAQPIEPDAPQHRLLMREMIRPTGLLDDVVRSFAGTLHELVLGIVTEILPAKASPLDRQLMVFSVFGQCIHYRMAKPVMRLILAPDELEQFTLETIADHITQVIVSACRSRYPSQV